MKFFAFANDCLPGEQPVDEQLQTLADALRGLADTSSSLTITARRLASTSASLPSAAGAIDAAALPLIKSSMPTKVFTVKFSAGSLDPSAAHLTITSILPGAQVYAVEESVARANTRLSPSKLSRVGLLVRHKDMSVEGFWHHWTCVHLPLVLAHEPLFESYATNLITEPTRTWDGVVEQWFTDKATWNEHDRRLREEKLEIARDIREFVGHIVQFEATEVGTVRV